MMDIDISWEKALESEIQKQYFIDILSVIDRPDINIMPKRENVFLALKLTPLENVKVVLIAQDPYPTPGYAHGLAFSVERHITKLPKSLQNIFKELQDDLGKYPKHGNLEHLAKQGVLLLNCFLSIENGKTLSHKNLQWEKFTDNILHIVSESKENVVFILLGNYARKKRYLINDRKHLILETSHPSFFSAHKGFFGSKIFSKTNEYLQNTNQKEINFYDE